MGLRVLYLGVFLDGSGWARAAVDYALALDQAGVDVVCRPVRLNSGRHEVPRRIHELVAKPSGGCDVVVQHLLPHLAEYGPFKRNVCLFASESSHFRPTCWADRLNLMDEVWVVNDQQVSACQRSGVARPVRVVPHACDLARYQRSYQPFPELARLKERGEFLFLWLGEWSRRKNVTGLLRAFHAEFDPDENVRLVVKTSAEKGQVYSHIAQVKEGMKLRGGYHSDEVVITDRMSDEDVLRLHASCDCFVSTSHGEAFCYPAFDAMALGKTPIAPAWGGFLSYLSDRTGYLVSAHEENCFGATDTLQDIYTAEEDWAFPDTASLRKAMRLAFEDRDLRALKAAEGVKRAYDFSYPEVGALMKGLLHASLEGRPTGGGG